MEKMIFFMIWSFCFGFAAGAIIAGAVKGKPKTAVNREEHKDLMVNRDEASNYVNRVVKRTPSVQPTNRNKDRVSDLVQEALSGPSQMAVASLQDELDESHNSHNHIQVF